MQGGERRERAAQRSSMRSGAACALACAVLLAGCGGSSPKYLDMTQVKRAIQQSILQQRHLTAAVVCPEKELQKPHKFACIATTISRSSPHRAIKTPFLVSVLDDKGRVRYIGLNPPRPSQ